MYGSLQEIIDALAIAAFETTFFAGYLQSLAHELVHYWQWIETGDITERGVVIRARSIVDSYASTTDSP